MQKTERTERQDEAATCCWRASVNFAEFDNSSLVTRALPVPNNAGVLLLAPLMPTMSLRGVSMFPSCSEWVASN